MIKAIDKGKTIEKYDKVHEQENYGRARSKWPIYI